MLNLRGNYLKLYLGCMYSGKSTSLLNEMIKYKIITDKIVMINNILDKKRYTEEQLKMTSGFIGIIKTHDNKTCKALMTQTLSELHTNPFFYDEYKKAEVVIIDEGQFFDDLYDFIKMELSNLSQKKLFIIGGLSGDSDMKIIGDLIKLIPLADEVIKLNAYCVKCKNGTNASFTKRLIKNTEQILVGKEDIYIPVCRYHYYIQ